MNGSILQYLIEKDPKVAEHLRLLREAAEKHEQRAESISRDTAAESSSASMPGNRDEPNSAILYGNRIRSSILLSLMSIIIIITAGTYLFLYSRQREAHAKFIEVHDKEPVYVDQQPRDAEKPGSNGSDDTLLTAPRSRSGKYPFNPPDVPQKSTEIDRFRFLEGRWRASEEYSKFHNWMILFCVFMLPPSVLWVGVLAVQLRGYRRYATAVINAQKQLNTPLSELEQVISRASVRLRTSYSRRRLVSIITSIGVIPGALSASAFLATTDRLQYAIPLGIIGILSFVAVFKWSPFEHVSRLLDLTEATDALSANLRMQLAEILAIPNRDLQPNAQWQAVNNCLAENQVSNSQPLSGVDADRSEAPIIGSTSEDTLPSNNQKAQSNRPRHTILFLASNPLHGHQALDREAHAIHVELQRSGHGDRFAFVTRWAVEPLDLLRELRKLRPIVVHFSGYNRPSERESPSSGDMAGSVPDTAMIDQSVHDGLYFRAAAGMTQFVSAVAIQQTFGAAGSSVRLVVLDACYSGSQADALLNHVECVIGMSKGIHRDAARSFAIGFYGGLGERESVAAAYAQGRAAIALEGLHDEDLTQLRARPDVDPQDLILTELS